MCHYLCTTGCLHACDVGVAMPGGHGRTNAIHTWNHKNQSEKKYFRWHDNISKKNVFCYSIWCTSPSSCKVEPGGGLQQTQIGSQQAGKLPKHSQHKAMMFGYHNKLFDTIQLAAHSHRIYKRSSSTYGTVGSKGSLNVHPPFFSNERNMCTF